MGDTPVSWASRLQKCTARSTAEAEFIALSSMSQELLYLQMLVAHLHHPTEHIHIYANEGTEEKPGCVARWREYNALFPKEEHSTVQAFTDSQNAVAIASSPPGWLHESLRHVKTHFMFVKQYIQDGTMILNHCPGKKQPADLLTKGFFQKQSRTSKSKS